MLTTLHSRLGWIFDLIYNYFQELTVSKPLCIMNIIFVRVDSFCVRKAFSAPHTCLWKLVTELSKCSLPLLADKKRNHLTFDFVFMSASFLNLSSSIWCFFFCGSLCCFASRAFQITSRGGVIGLQSQLILRKSRAQSVNLRGNCNFGPNVIFSPSSSFVSSSSHSSRREKLLHCGQMWWRWEIIQKAVVFSAAWTQWTRDQETHTAKKIPLLQTSKI